jgi:hypothetical protein
MKRIFVVLCVISAVSIVSAQTEKVLYFEWTSIPSYTNFASTKMLEPGQGEIGFSASNFYMWSMDTASYDTRTHDLLFRIGIIPHMEFGLKYSAARAVVLDVRGGFNIEHLEFAGSLGFGYMKATKFVQPGNNTLWLYDGYPTISAGYEFFPWLRLVASGKGIISHYIREKVDPPQNFTTIHTGLAITLDVGTDEWRVRPEYTRYWGRTNYTLAEEPIGFKTGTLGIGVLYRPRLKDKD